MAAVAGTREPRWVDVSVLSDGDALVVTVADSGEGLRPSDPRPRADDGGGDSVHGHGIGLPLATEIARRSGGDLWIIDPGGPDHGAVFAARLGDAVDPAPRVPKEDR